MTFRAAEEGEIKESCWFFLKTRRYLRELISSRVSPWGRVEVLAARCNLHLEGSRGEPKEVPGVCHAGLGSPPHAGTTGCSQLGQRAAEGWQLFCIAWSMGYLAGASDLEILFCC